MFQVAQRSHTWTSIQHSNENSHVKSESLFDVENILCFNFRRYAVSTKINYGENFPIYGIFLYSLATTHG